MESRACPGGSPPRDRWRDLGNPARAQSGSGTVPPRRWRTVPLVVGAAVAGMPVSWGTALSMGSINRQIMTLIGYAGLRGRPAAPRHAPPMAIAGHPHRRRPRGRRARRPPAAVSLQRRRPGDAGPGHLLAHRGQPLPGQDRRRRVRHPALPGIADPLPLPPARRERTGPPDGPPADPQRRPAAAGPPVGRAGPHPRRDRAQAGRVPVPDLRADQAARHAARPRPPVRGGRGHRGNPPGPRLSEVTKEPGPPPAPGPLFEEAEVTEAPAAGPAAGDGEDTAPGQRPGTTESTTVGEGEQDTGGSGDGAGTDGQSAGDERAGAEGDGEGASWRVATRIESGTVACRYAGAMLVPAFADRIGAGGLLRAGTGASAAGTGSAAGAGAGDLGILVCTQMSFTLGALTLEQARHLTAADAGALAGLTRLPSLRTWRQRLGELAGRSDPLALQRRLASQMLAIEPAESQVYLADDHLAEYTGHQRVAMGRNPRRGKPAKGHDDTYICDLAGRAIAFTTGEPSALCTTLPGALAALTGALPAGHKPGEANRPLIVFDRGAAFSSAFTKVDAARYDSPTYSSAPPPAPPPHKPGEANRPLIVFDRGAAFSSAFTKVDAAGYDWLTWRRAPLQPTTRLPVLQAITLPGGRQREVAWTDEQITLKDYGRPVRQLTLFEHGKMAAQAISGRLDACPAELLGWLRGRRAEENMFKYDMASYGLDVLADYAADEVTSTKLKASPAFTKAKKAETAAKTGLAAAETALAKLLADRATPARTKNDVLIPSAQKKIAACEQKLEKAQAERKKHRAKLPASEIDPAATSF